MSTSTSPPTELFAARTQADCSSPSTSRAAGPSGAGGCVAGSQTPAQGPLVLHFAPSFWHLWWIMHWEQRAEQGLTGSWRALHTAQPLLGPVPGGQKAKGRAGDQLLPRRHISGVTRHCPEKPLWPRRWSLLHGSRCPPCVWRGAPRPPIPPQQTCTPHRALAQMSAG